MTKKQKAQHYYQEHKEEYQARNKKYLEKLKTDPERLAEKNRRRREYKRAYLSDPDVRARSNSQKRVWERARLKTDDPVKLAQVRRMRREGGIRWLEKMKAEDPERYAAYRERQLAIDRARKAEKRKHPDYWPKFNAYQRARRERDPRIKLAQALRNTISSALRGRYKAGTFIELIGCSQKELVGHLERQFAEGMSWQLYGHGKGKWSVDHVVPCASFNLSDPDQQKLCFHYTNLKPMWFVENCSKNSIHDGRWHRHKDHDISLVQ